MLDVTLLFLGLPVILRRESRNIFVSAGICLLMVGGFVIVVLGCHQAGGSTLIKPALAAWLPVMLFVPLTRNTMRASGNDAAVTLPDVQDFAKSRSDPPARSC